MCSFMNFTFLKFTEESYTVAFRQATNGADKARSNTHHQMTQPGIEPRPSIIQKSNMLLTELFDGLNIVNNRKDFMNNLFVFIRRGNLTEETQLTITSSNQCLETAARCKTAERFHLNPPKLLRFINTRPDLTEASMT